VVVTETSVRASAALKRLPPFPAVAGRVAQLLASELTSFYDVAELLETDAALSAEVLRLANSPLFGVRYEIGNVMQALAVLGSRRVATLMMTLMMSKLMGRVSRSETVRRLWRHNLACALAARHLAELQYRDSIEAYHAGLFHEIGRLALFAHDPKFYDQALRCGDGLDEMERSHFGVDHCEAGAWVIEQWKLPKSFIEVVLDYQNPKPDSSDLTLIVNLACEVADRLGFSVTSCENVDEVDLADEIGYSITLAVNSLQSEFGL
jgi:HD-like signal output (HDOD) protein